MEEQRPGFLQREPDTRSPGAPKLSFSCTPVSDFKAVTTVKTFFYAFSSHYQDAITHTFQLNYSKKMTAHTAVLPFPFLIPAEILNGLKFPGLQLLPKCCLGSRKNITNTTYRVFSMMEYFYLPQIPPGKRLL